METSLFEHVLSVLIFGLFPLYVLVTYPGWVRRVEREGEPARIAGYRETMVWWVAFAGAVVIVWGYRGFPWADLGFRHPLTLRLGLTWVIVAAVLALLVLQLRAARRGAIPAAQVADRFRSIEALLPGTRRERVWFRALAVNAGITEEIVHRGFLLWYLGTFTSTWVAAGLAVVAFTYGHMYQGVKHVPALVVASALMVGLYLLGGSLWPVIVLHAAADILQAEILIAVRAGQRPDPGETAPAPQPA